MDLAYDTYATVKDRMNNTNSMMSRTKEVDLTFSYFLIFIFFSIYFPLFYF